MIDAWSDGWNDLGMILSGSTVCMREVSMAGSLFVKEKLTVGFNACVIFGFH
jgi:hypothetical protein